MEGACSGRTPSLHNTGSPGIVAEVVVIWPVFSLSVASVNVVILRALRAVSCLVGATGERATSTYRQVAGPLNLNFIASVS
jgi:hypothetical protein